MKKILFMALIVSVFYSCGGGTTGGGSNGKAAISVDKVDLQMLSNTEGIKKAYDLMIAKLDTNVRFVEDIRLSIDKEKDGTNDLTVKLTYVHPTNANKLFDITYYASQGKWTNEQTMNVELSPGSNVESFVLKDEVMDLSNLTLEKLTKVLQDGFNKFKDEAKFKDQHIYQVDIYEDKINVFVKGIVTANEMVKEDMYTVKLNSIL